MKRGAERNATVILKEQVILFDLWQTLITSLPEDPIVTMQRLLDNSRAKVSDAKFSHACLTTAARRPGEFLDHVARLTDRKSTRALRHQFRQLVADERRGVRLYTGESIETLAALKAQGKRLGVISNIWPFPVHRIFYGLGLHRWFEHRLLSCEVGLRKPQPQIFQMAAQVFGVKPAECRMVGDGLSSDIDGALAVGMQATHIQRGAPTAPLPVGATRVGSLIELV
jgi:HAD superfamily hydrolase (TIGR01509 family)